MEDLTGGRSRSPWSSSVDSSELLDSCSDATSVVAVAELHESRGNGTMERCASCISKLGSSVKSSAFSPAWTMEQQSRSSCVAQHDRASLSSGSSGGSSATTAADWYDRPRNVCPPAVPPKSPRRAVPPPTRCQCCPPERPPKPPSPKKCPRALPGHAQQQLPEEHNYDVPRSFLHNRTPVS